MVACDLRAVCENQSVMRGSIQAILIQSIGLAFLTVSAWGAGWTEYQAGPFHVISDAGERAARDRLIELEQLRHAMETFLGKADIATVWPIDIVLFPNAREYGPHAPPKPLVEGPDANLGAWMADTPLPHDLLREIARQMLEDNAGRMPERVEQGLEDLMASIQVKEVKGAPATTLGAPPGAGELSEERMRAWAKIQMLATLPEFNGKLRVYLNNLQGGGEEEMATHNAFNLTPAELDKRGAEYFAAGHFVAVPLLGPVNQFRDFRETRIPDAGAAALIADLKADGQDFPPESPRGLLKQGTKESLQAAVKANPRWAEPHVAMADLEYDPVEKAKELKLAAALEPRNSEIWQALALAQTDSQLFPDAEKSWVMAERNALNDADKARIRKARLDMNETRVEYEIRQKKRKTAEDAQELEAVKQAAEARIHAAEDAANKRNGTLKPGSVVVPWWNDEEGEKLSGTLTRVDCLNGDVLRLTVQPATGSALRLLIPNSHNLAVKGVSEVKFICGDQRPVKAINLVHDGKPDAQQGTAGNVRMVELP
jgi:hypothetical protein